MMLRSFIILSLFAHACAEGVEELHPSLILRDLGKNYSAMRLGAASTTDTSDCGSTSGSFTSIPEGNYYSQVGCSGLYTSMSVDFSLTNPNSNSVKMFVIKGSDCRSGITASTPYIAPFPTSGSLYFKQSCGNTDTCCVAIFCVDSSSGACSGMTYTSNFITVVNGGAVAGIVIGGLIFIGLVAFGVISYQLHRVAFIGQSTTNVSVYQTMQNPVAHSSYQGAQPPNPGYQQQQQQPSYQQQQPSYQQQQPYQQQQQPVYNPPPQPTFMQSQPQAWGQSPSKY